MVSRSGLREPDIAERARAIGQLELFEWWQLIGRGSGTAALMRAGGGGGLPARPTPDQPDRSPKPETPDHPGPNPEIPTWIQDHARSSRR